MGRSLGEPRWGRVRKKAIRALAPLLALALVSLATPGAAFLNLKPGQGAPGFSLESAAGKGASLSDFAGKTVVIAFVRQGQEKSAQALKDLAAVNRSVEGAPAVLAVVVNPGEGDAQKWADDLGIDYPVLVDRAGDVYGLYGVRVVPSTGVIGSEGHFQGVVNGHSASYRGEIDDLTRQALGLAPSNRAEAAAPVAVSSRSEERKTAQRHLEQARILLERNMREKAVGSAREAIAADTSYAEGHVFLGTLLLDISGENADQALGHFEKALELEPKNVDAKVGLARVKSLKGEYREAVAILEESARLNPKPEKIYYQLGLVHEQAGEYRKAVEAYRKALERLLP